MLCQHGDGRGYRQSVLHRLSQAADRRVRLDPSPGIRRDFGLYVGHCPHRPFCRASGRAVWTASGHDSRGRVGRSVFDAAVPDDGFMATLSAAARGGGGVYGSGPCAGQYRYFALVYAQARSGHGHGHDRRSGGRAADDALCLVVYRVGGLASHPVDPGRAAVADPASGVVWAAARYAGRPGVAAGRRDETDRGRHAGPCRRRGGDVRPRYAPNRPFLGAHRYLFSGLWLSLFRDDSSVSLFYGPRLFRPARGPAGECAAQRVRAQRAGFWLGE